MKSDCVSFEYIIKSLYFWYWSFFFFLVDCLCLSAARWGSGAEPCRRGEVWITAGLLISITWKWTSLSSLQSHVLWLLNILLKFTLLWFVHFQVNRATSWRSETCCCPLSSENDTQLLVLDELLHMHSSICLLFVYCVIF